MLFDKQAVLLAGPVCRDWFGTFHSAPKANLNGGTVNAVFVDAHVDEVRSALKQDTTDRSEMEYNSREKFGWPFNKPPN